MNKLKYYISGFVFIAVAVISLYLMLSWAHPTKKTQIPLFEGSTIVEKTPLGIPFIWANDIKSETKIFSEADKNRTEKQIEAPKLLANLIVWGVALGLLALLLNIMDRKLIK